MKVGDVGLARLREGWTPARILAIHETGTLSVTDTTRYASFLADWHSLCAQDWASEGTELPPASPWRPLWWNQVRMGGARLEDLPQPVGVPEAVAALGLGAERDPASDAAMSAFGDAHGLRLPEELRDLAGRAGFLERFSQAHCNAPSWEPVTRWKVHPGLRALGFPWDLAVELVVPHQGEHVWMLGFDPGDPVGVMLVHEPEEDPQAVWPTAPSLAAWIWDLVRSNADWRRGTDVRRP